MTDKFLVDYLVLMIDEYPEAIIETYKLEYGYQLVKHYDISGYGDIDTTVIRYSIEQLEYVLDKVIYVKNCRSYEQAMVTFIAQVQSPTLRCYDSLVMWICKLLNINVGHKIL